MSYKCTSSYLMVKYASLTVPPLLLLRRFWKCSNQFLFVHRDRSQHKRISVSVKNIGVEIPLRLKWIWTKVLDQDQRHEYSRTCSFINTRYFKKWTRLNVDILNYMLWCLFDVFGALIVSRNISKISVHHSQKYEL